jgi:long-chain acyl-CoA synthetase
MIIAGGVNIYPAEIESALREHPGVLDAAAFGIPHSEWGEEVKAVVELVAGGTVSEAELLRFIADKLAGYKRPRSIDFVAEIPRNPAGKVLKTELRAPYWQATGKAI